MENLKDIKIACEDIFRSKEITLTYKENNQYFEITDAKGESMIIPKYIISNGCVFKMKLDDLGFDGYFFLCDYYSCTITINLHLRDISCVGYWFFQAIMYALWYSVDQLNIPEEITDDMYKILTSSLYKIMQENKIIIVRNYNRVREELFRIPTKIKVTGTTYKIKLCKNLQSSDDSYALGIFCNKLSPHHGIYIATECKNEPVDYNSMCLTFIHELTHAILFESGHDLVSEEDCNKEEQICDFMAYRICDLLRNNDFEIKFN